MNLPIKIASRSSPLALTQVEEVLGELKAKGIVFAYELLKYQTKGDHDKATPLTTNPADNFFTDAIDDALIKGEADVAIHSAKDLPRDIHEGLNIFALTATLDDKDAWVGRLPWGSLPHGAKVGTSSLLRQQQITRMRPDVRIVDIRGTIHERIQLVKEGKVDGIIVAACALKRLKLGHEINGIFPWEGIPLQGQLAIVGRRQDSHLRQLFDAIDVRRSYGKVMLVGAGPGDPELITVKAIKALEKTDCVFYDYLADAGLLKYAPQAEHIYVGKRKGVHSMTQEALSQMLKKKVLAGKNVVRLKGGDPLVFGRGGEEINYLRAYHMDVEVIPGISSATGIPSYLGIPLTARGISSSVAFISGHEEGEDKNTSKPVRIPQAQTLVFLMSLTKLKIIMESLKSANWPAITPAMIITNGTQPKEQIVHGTIETIEHLAQEANLKPPALIIVGKILDFYKPRAKPTFLYCGTHPKIYSHLGNVLHWPMIDIKPAALNEGQQKHLWQEFEKADVILCTSCYGAQYLIKALLAMKSVVDFSHKIFAAIGKRTEDTLGEFNIKSAVVAQEETAQGLFETLTKAMEVKGKRILFPRSSLPNPFLKEALAKDGAIVTEIAIYENTKPAKRDLPKASIDGVIFTSPSTVRNFLTDYATIPDSWQIIAKGPVTLKTLQEAGYSYATALP